ncbi:MAG: glycosyltransferase family 2 protein [Bacteroidetes bacterium]|nr:glycosyltransferase family 2 protein [Bacteroidota bacterium]
MNVFLWVLAAIHGALIVNAIGNLMRFRHAKSKPYAAGPLPKISVLVPARNEEHHLPRLIQSFNLQDHPNAELIVYDDLSSDDTWSIISASENERVSGLRGTALPEGWVGKVHACYQLSLKASGKVLLFIDADTEFQSPEALQRMCRRFETRPTSTILTGMTLLKGRGQLIVTMVGNLILACIPWWLGKHMPFHQLSAVNGQCWMIETKDYRRLEPHVFAKNEVLEDVMIGRYLHKRGLIPLLDDVRSELAVYMYSSFGEAWKGFRKNSAAALGSSTWISSITLLIYFLIFVAAPFFNIWFLFSIYALKWITDQSTNHSFIVTLLTPFSYLLTILIGIDSIFTRSRGRIEWKGRTIK